MTTAQVYLWGEYLGAVRWNPNEGFADFEYTPQFVESKLEVSPIIMPLVNRHVFSFPALQRSITFRGLPGLLADSLPEKFGNKLLTVWMAKKGLSFDDLDPVARLCYLGSRGMGALEFVPDTDGFSSKEPIDFDGLLDVAKQVMSDHNGTSIEDPENPNFERLIQIGTSAGGAKAKAVIAWNESTGEIMSGQGECRKGFNHYLLKLSGVSNDEHESDPDIGRVEMAYHLMAVEAGITMMESRLLHGGGAAHFMTRRFDRDSEGGKYHVQTYCAIAHQDRDPVGTTSYEHLFSTARRLGLGQVALNELYLRMVFNIAARNQDDHSKNHAFLMDGNGKWYLTPAYDLCFAYKKGSRWIDQHQMRCNGKRDEFNLADLEAAAEAADVRNFRKYISQVKDALALWPELAASVGLPADKTNAISAQFRRF